MVDIEECSLGSFEQYFFAPLHGTMQVNDRVCHVRPQFFASGKISFVNVAKTDRLSTERLKDSIVLSDLGLKFLREDDRLHQVGHTQTGASCLVSVGWSNAALGRSNPAASQFPLFVE